VDPRGGRRADRPRDGGAAVGLGARSALGRTLRGRGFAARRPARRATGRREPEVRAWPRRDDPAIAGRAEAEGAEIHRADATGPSDQATAAAGAPRPRATHPCRRGPPAARFSQPMISGLTDRGTLRPMVYDGALTAATFLAFLSRLVKGAGARRAQAVRPRRRPARAPGRGGRGLGPGQRREDRAVLPPALRARARPGRIPEQRRRAGRGAAPGPQGQGASLKAGLTSYMRGLQRRPAKVRAFFQAPSVRYAA